MSTDNGNAHAAFERHFSVEQLAELWGMSNEFVRKLFRDEPGVVVFSNPQRGKRVYRTLRIPESVAARVHRRMTAEQRVAHSVVNRRSRAA